MKKRVLSSIGAAAVAVLALAACASDPLAEEGATAGADGASGDLTEVSVVVAPIHFEPAYIAQQEGYFEEQGLDVEIIAGASPTANIARVVSGEVDITTGSLGTAVTSSAQGVPVTMIGGNGYTSPDFATSGVITMGTSDIESVADLEGRTIGIQGLNTGSEIPLFLAAEAAGIDPLSIERVELASAGMETALVEGTVDAVLASAPHYNQLMERDDIQLLSNPSTEYMAGTPVTTWMVSDSWLETNAETAGAFVSAMEEAQAFYEDPANIEAVLDITAEVSQVERASLTADSLIPVSVAIDEEMATVQVDAFTKYGLVDTPVTLDDFLWSEAPRR